MVAEEDSKPIWVRSLAYLFQSRITKVGTVLTTSAAISLLFFWAAELSAGRAVHPYLGILLFLVLPGIFVFGLLLIPFGAWIARRARRKRGEADAPMLGVDPASPVFRRAVVVAGGLTFLNVLIVGVAAYRGIEYMDSTQFCGLTCHSVMAPEYAAYQDSPHARVGCVGCHIGPGAGWFVKSKLSGVRQVYAVNFKTYSRPIPVPVKALRPARETCEQCHWPEKFHGDKVVVRTHFADDEANTVLKTVLVLHIGGQANGRYEGIHGRHLDKNAPIVYTTGDEKRQRIGFVSVKSGTGNAVDFAVKDLHRGVADEASKSCEACHGRLHNSRTMDCVDCHNRPTHRMYSPERAMDMALLEGRISRNIPYIRKQGVEALKAAQGDRNQALGQISSRIEDFYRKNYPDMAQAEPLRTAIKQIQALWERNVFPEMNVTWGTYPEHIGHSESPGCFRCHDGEHATRDGRAIASDCDTCHAILAQDESDPKILRDLGIR